jgi:hypothetical protein
MNRGCDHARERMNVGWEVWTVQRSCARLTTMWVPNLSLPFSLLGLVAQVPLQPSAPSQPLTAMVSNQTNDFTFKEGSNILSPRELIELERPGHGVANPSGDLLLISTSKYSLEKKKYV